MFKKEMTKTEFTAMIAELMGDHCRLDYVDPETQLGIRDFVGWRDWFGYGEWDVGVLTIRVKPKTKQAENYLVGRGFRSE